MYHVKRLFWVCLFVNFVKMGGLLVWFILSVVKTDFMLSFGAIVYVVLLLFVLVRCLLGGTLRLFWDFSCSMLWSFCFDLVYYPCCSEIVSSCFVWNCCFVYSIIVYAFVFDDVADNNVADVLMFRFKLLFLTIMFLNVIVFGTSNVAKIIMLLVLLYRWIEPS